MNNIIQFPKPVKIDYMDMNKIMPYVIKYMKESKYKATKIEIIFHDENEFDYEPDPVHDDKTCMACGVLSGPTIILSVDKNFIDTDQD